MSERGREISGPRVQDTRDFSNATVFGCALTVEAGGDEKVGCFTRSGPARGHVLNFLLHLGCFNRRCGACPPSNKYLSPFSFKLILHLPAPTVVAQQPKIRVTLFSLANKKCYHFGPLCIASIAASCRHCPQSGTGRTGSDPSTPWSVAGHCLPFKLHALDFCILFSILFCLLH